MHLLLEEADGSWVNTGWGPSAKFASDEVVLDVPGFNEMPSPPGEATDKAERPASPSLSSLPNFDSPMQETGVDSGGTQERGPKGATHLMSVDNAGGSA